METSWCHIVGFNPISKQLFKSKMSNLKYNIIDLDEINLSILDSTNITNLFKQYQGFKNSKNDKYKEIDKKITLYWEKNMIESITSLQQKDIKNILIGYSNHFRNVSKRININIGSSPHANLFSIDITRKDIRDTIEYNLDKYRNDIIKGIFSLENIDFDYLYTTKTKLLDSYKKNGYMEKSLDAIISILEMNSTIKDMDGLWIALAQPYNVSAKIYPAKNDKLFGFTDINMALLSSFNFLEDDLKKEYHNNVLKIIPKNLDVLEKLKTKRYLYFVDRHSFMPHEKGNNIKYFSQIPIKILSREKINNVYEKLI